MVEAPRSGVRLTSPSSERDRARVNLRAIRSGRGKTGAVLLAVHILASSPKAHASPVREAYHQVLPDYANYLVHIDALDDILWSSTSFSELEVWQMLLHSALAAQCQQLEAIAQKELVRLGMTGPEIDALYRLDDGALDPKQRATMVYVQRSAVLPTRVNANDVDTLRRYYSHQEVAELATLNAYFNMFLVLYGTGFVDQDSTLAHPGLEPNLEALQQTKDEDSASWSDRHYFESAALVLDLSMPMLLLDTVMLEEPHSFGLDEVWEMFVIAQKAADCKHCVTHGAFGMHLEYASPERIVAAYDYDGSTEVDARRKARFNFLQAAVPIPSRVTQGHREALTRNYSREEVQHLIGIASVIGVLSTYMQVTAVITDEESKNFAEKILGPRGFVLGRHVGPPEEQRAMHPTTMRRLRPAEDGLGRTKLFYGNSLYAASLGAKYPLVPGPLLHAMLELCLLSLLIVGHLVLQRRSRERGPTRLRYLQLAMQGLLSLVFIAAGVANLSGGMSNALQILGFPPYLTTILGVAYLLAVIAIHQPWIPFLQEWAWSGLFISLIGATASHMHTGMADAAPAFILQLLLIGTYLLRPHVDQSRSVVLRPGAT